MTVPGIQDVCMTAEQGTPFFATEGKASCIHLDSKLNHLFIYSSRSRLAVAAHRHSWKTQGSASISEDWRGVEQDRK